MHNETLHIPDGDLLLMSDGELPPRRADQVRAHLAACWSCRARMAEIESTIVEFARACRETAGVKLPPIAGSRSLLSAHMAELASRSGTQPWRLFRSFPSVIRVATVCAAIVCTVFISRLVLHSATQHGTNLETSSLDGEIPDGRLTPGATRVARMDDLCSSAHEEVVGQVTAQLRNAVLKEYGISASHAGDYEIDYLIAPGLGGTEYIHNLWPQPYSARTWNAYTKDALEERLHQLVCRRKLNLAVAQQDIANNWIAAYKKYFGTNNPLPSTVDPVSVKP